MASVTFIAFVVLLSLGISFSGDVSETKTASLWKLLAGMGNGLHEDKKDELREELVYSKDEPDTAMLDLLRDMLKRVKEVEKQYDEEELSRTRRGSHDTCSCKEALYDVMRRANHMDDLTECYKEADGSDYRGLCHHTSYGSVCQNWAKQTPHSHSFFTGEEVIDNGIGNHSYCRNPDGANRPWCYTTKKDTRVEYCDMTTPMESCTKSNFTLVGATFTRYGRYECPVGVERVYHGFVGGTSSVDQGGGNNFLCMPHDPVYGEVVDRVQSDRAYIYHSQYAKMTGSRKLRRVYKGDVPCVVCRVPNRNSILMVPARNVCPDDTWHLEYYGVLAAQSSAIRSYTSSYICLDIDSLKIPFTNKPVQGNEVFNVESRCSDKPSAMSCSGSYQDGAELLCAVCSK
ncbi:uncharacterized protein [Ptychodera flava]|uniref:uncharacterized protein n=1 Tax=Ptychodera flava TaxID=63121 RepID=UPI00396AA7EC